MGSVQIGDTLSLLTTWTSRYSMTLVIRLGVRELPCLGGCPMSFALFFVPLVVSALAAHKIGRALPIRRARL